MWKSNARSPATGTKSSGLSGSTFTRGGPLEAETALLQVPGTCFIAEEAGELLALRAMTCRPLIFFGPTGVRADAPGPGHWPEFAAGVFMGHAPYGLYLCHDRLGERCGGILPQNRGRYVYSRRRPRPQRVPKHGRYGAKTRNRIKKGAGPRPNGDAGPPPLYREICEKGLILVFDWIVRISHLHPAGHRSLLHRYEP